MAQHGPLLAAFALLCAGMCGFRLASSCYMRARPSCIDPAGSRRMSPHLHRAMKRTALLDHAGICWTMMHHDVPYANIIYDQR